MSICKDKPVTLIPLADYGLDPIVLVEQKNFENAQTNGHQPGKLARGFSGRGGTIERGSGYRGNPNIRGRGFRGIGGRGGSTNRATPVVRDSRVVFSLGRASGYAEESTGKYWDEMFQETTFSQFRGNHYSSHRNLFPTAKFKQIEEDLTSSSEDDVDVAKEIAEDIKEIFASLSSTNSDSNIFSDIFHPSLLPISPQLQKTTLIPTIPTPSQPPPPLHINSHPSSQSISPSEPPTPSTAAGVSGSPIQWGGANSAQQNIDASTFLPQFKTTQGNFFDAEGRGKSQSFAVQPMSQDQKRVSAAIRMETVEEKKRLAEETEKAKSEEETQGELVGPGAIADSQSTKVQGTVQAKRETFRINAVLPCPKSRRRPGPIDLSSTARTPPPRSALAAARFIEDLRRVSYPEGIRSPKVELNVNAKSGKFR